MIEDLFNIALLFAYLFQKCLIQLFSYFCSPHYNLYFIKWIFITFDSLKGTSVVSALML